MMTQSYRSVTPRRTALAHSILVLASTAVMGSALAAPPDAATNLATGANRIPSAAVAAPDPARQAYSASFNETSTASLTASFGKVPNGKRLVIESESVLCSVTNPSPILYAYMYTNFGRTYMLLQKSGSASGFDYYAGTFTSTMFADPTGLGTGDISFFVQSAASYYGSPVLHCTGSIVGHNVTAPPH